VAAFDIAALMEYKNYKIEDAASLVINDKIGKLGGNGGVIAIDKKGNIAMEMNTPGMYRAHMNSEGKILVKIYKDE
jgi:beta-aspartyl-peptidase (threonine type)